MKKLEKNISLNDKKNKYLVLDTETIHSGVMNGDTLQTIKDIIEVSWKVLDCDGVEVLGSKKGFIVKELWEDKTYLSSTNYMVEKKQIVEKENFALGKIDKWEKALANGTLKVATWGEIMKALNYDITHYKVSLFSAYNIKFDRQALYDTTMLLKHKRHMKIWDIDFIDIMEMVKIIAKNKDFKTWSDNHGSKTAKNHYKTSAEAVYRFLTNNSVELETEIPDSTSWSETHLAIEDIDCEAVIIQGCLTLARRKRDIKVLANHLGGWQALNKLIKAFTKKTSKNKQLELKLDK